MGYNLPRLGSSLPTRLQNFLYLPVASEKAFAASISSTRRGNARSLKKVYFFQKRQNRGYQSMSLVKVPSKRVNLR